MFAALHLLLLALTTAPARALDPAPGVSAPAAPFEIEEQLILVTMPDGYLMEVELFWPKNSVDVPIHVFLHGSGASRLLPQSEAQDLAKLGFLTVLMDLPGQGPSINRNFPGPPNSDYGFRFFDELTQLYIARVIEEVRTSFTPMASRTVLSMSGTSQGAIHCLISAAMSGKPFSHYLVQEGLARPGQVFPRVQSVTCAAFGPNLVAQFFPQGRAYSLRFLQTIYQPAGVPPWDWNKGPVQGTWIAPSFLRLLRPTAETMRAKDALTLLREVDGFNYIGEPSGMMADLIRSSTHIDINLAADDGWRGLRETIQLLARRDRPGVYSFLNVDGAGGHRAPEVPAEAQLRKDRRTAFLLATVKGDNSRIGELDFGEGPIYETLDDLPAVTWALAPPELASYWFGPELWDRVYLEDWSALRPGAPSWPGTEYYLRSKNRLTTNPPGTLEGYTQIDQIWRDASFGWLDLLDEIASGESLIGRRLIGLGPASMIQWTSAEFLSEVTDHVNIVGPGHAGLHLLAAPGEFQLNVGLFHSKDRGRTWRHITSGSLTVVDYKGGISYQEVPLNPGAYGPLEPGDILRVSIIPIAIHRANYPDANFGEIEHAPLMGPRQLVILHDAAHPSMVRIPELSVENVHLDQ